MLTVQQLSAGNGYRGIIKDDASLATFLRQLAKFDTMFCDAMADGGEFTLRLEVRGVMGEVLHVRAYNENLERPEGVDERLAAKKRLPSRKKTIAKSA